MSFYKKTQFLEIIETPEEADILPICHRSDLAICPFNRTHHVSHAELQLHKIVCQDRRVIEQDM